MKKKILLVTVLVLTLCGCEKTIPKLADGKEAVVSFNNDQLISVDDLYTEMKDTYALQTLLDMIDNKIFEEKYKDKLDEAKKNADSTLASLKLNYTDENGKYDESKLVQALYQYFGFSSVDDYHEYVRMNYLRNLAVEDYTKSQVTESEIKKYYKDEVVGDREVSHILIIPEVKDNMTDTEKEAAEKAALDKAKEVITKLKKGETFESLAKTYSDDEATKDSAGSLGFINKGSYGSDVFDQEVYKLKVGTYSSTPIKTSKGYEIVYVTKENEKKSLEYVRDTIVEKLSEEKLNNDATVQVNALKELREEYKMSIKDDELKRQYDKYMDRALASAKEQNATK